MKTWKEIVLTEKKQTSNKNQQIAKDIIKKHKKVFDALADM